MKRVAFYVRCSTKRQELSNQVRELEEVARNQDWQVLGCYQDFGVSGGKGRDERQGLDRLLKDVARKKFDIVAVWSVDRLGRSLKDLIATMTEIRENGCGLFFYKQAIDTTTSMGKMMFQLLGVFAEFEREIIRERIRAGVERAVANGAKLGRKRKIDGICESARTLRKEGFSLRTIAKKLDVSPMTIARALR
jgi:DNA invertase Pin-like site-specific DNA recombinase